MKILSDEAIEGILEKQLWKDGVYIADSLDITLTVFQLKAIARKAEKEYLRQVVEWGDGDCLHLSQNVGTRRRDCPECWQELKAEGKG